MEILLLLIIAVLLCVVLYDIEKLMGQRSPLLPLRYVPRKNSILDKDSDMYALYYTDMLYPVFGREIIFALQSGYRNVAHKSFDAVFVARDTDKKKRIESLYLEVSRLLLERNMLTMMQANLDVRNGKLSISEARDKTLDDIEITNAIMPNLAYRQVAIDIEEGTQRHIEEYLNFDVLKMLEKQRKSTSTKNNESQDEEK